MSTDQVPVSLPLVGGKKATLEHPLGPLTATEIVQSSKIVKGLWPADIKIQFKAITLQEPNKAELVPFLNAEHSGSALPKVDRRSFVCYYLKNTVSLIAYLSFSHLFASMAAIVNYSGIVLTCFV